MNTLIKEQLKNKVQTHGVMLTVYYCSAFAVHRLMAPYRTHIRKTFSQAGEDILIDKLLGKKKHGFYVDIGAHHPASINNTKRFYDRGWRGINIEPNPMSLKLFEKERTRDINLLCGVGKSDEVLDFYEIGGHSALSSFDASLVNKLVESGLKIKTTRKIPVKTLKQIFSMYVREPIDFLSIDIEGSEEEALLSNDWGKWSPRLICIEVASDVFKCENQAIKERDDMLKKIGYSRVAVTKPFGRVLNAIYEKHKKGLTHDANK